MDESETYANMRFTGADTQSPSRAEPDVSYVELNVTALSAPRVRRDGAGLSSTYAEVNCPKDEPVIDEDEAPPIAAGSRKQTTNAQTGAHEQESKLKIGNRPFRLICLLCLVTSALIVIVIGLSIHVSQIRQSQTALDQNCHELNSTLQTKVSEISHLNHSEKTCLKNLTALKTNLSVLVRMHNDLRHQITEIKTKLRSVKNSMAQICEFLISRREERCPGNWTESADRCYFISTLEKSYDAARNHCSNVDASLLEINSNKEKDFVSNSIDNEHGTYWIGKCADGNVTSYLLYEMSHGSPNCSKSHSYQQSIIFERKHRFICEKSALFYPDIPEEIQRLCPEPDWPTSTM
ncbi:uncharacterized protein [Mobula birostris]|uniref:uncharacterized protein isoform X1 n=1 Tax=Mobula birostris TaxID=1983395 RepID=UPI003B28BDBE